MFNAQLHYKKEYQIDLKEEDTLSAIQNLRLLSIAQFKLGFVYESENSSIISINLLEKLEQNKFTDEAKNGIYTQLGRIYKELKNYKKSLEYYNRAILYTQNINDSLNLINNKANILIEQLKYSLAINELENVLKIRKNINDKTELARAQNNLGFVQSKVKDPLGIINMNQALKIRKEENDLIGLFSSYRYLTFYNIDRGKINVANNYANKCYEIAKSLNSNSYIKEALSLYVQLNEDEKILEYKALTDSIENAKQLRENKFASLKYDREKEIKKTNESNLQREKEKSLKYIYQSIAAFITLIFLASLIIFRIKNKKDKLEQIIKTESRISTKIHDEVANDIYHVMMKLEEKPEDYDSILEEIDGIYNKTRDISKENATVDVQEDYEMELKDLLMSYQNNNISIFTKNITTINWNKVSSIKKTTIYRVLQELMTNMKKHSNATHVVLNFKKNKKKLVIEYKDNGIGCELKKKSGLQNMENRIESIGGAINFESELKKGFKSIITI